MAAAYICGPATPPGRTLVYHDGRRRYGNKTPDGYAGIYLSSYGSDIKGKALRAARLPATPTKTAKIQRFSLPI